MLTHASMLMKIVKGIVYIVLCIDDNLMVSDVEAIHDAIRALKKRVGIENCGRAAGLLVLQIKLSMDKKRAWL